MHRLAVATSLALIAVPSLSSQTPWRAEFGIQGGYAHRTATPFIGTRDYYDFPGTNAADGQLSPSALFAIVPVDGPFAVELGFMFVQFTPPGSAGTTITVSARGDYALTRHVYVAVGGAVSHVDQYGGVPSWATTLLGAQVAAGYRLPLTDRLSGRLEASVLTVRKTDLTPPYTWYSILVGVAAGAPGGKVSRQPGDPTVWTRALGVAGGYVHSKVQGSTVSMLTFPAAGAAGVDGFVAPTPPTLFLILPLASRVALEPGLDLHQVNARNTGCLSGQVSARLDYGIGRWYVAPGLNVHAERCPLQAKRLVGIAGAGVSWGYRFLLPAALQGRVELGYTATKARADFHPAATAFTLMLGVAEPID